MTNTVTRSPAGQQGGMQVERQQPQQQQQQQQGQQQFTYQQSNNQGQRLVQVNQQGQVSDSCSIQKLQFIGNVHHQSGSTNPSIATGRPEH